MILLIILALMSVSTGIVAIVVRKKSVYENSSLLSDVLSVISVVVGAVLIIMLIIAPIKVYMDNKDISTLRQVYALLQKGVERDPKVLDFDLAQKIMRYNSYVSNGQYWNNNPLTSVFWSDCWNTLETIEIPGE